MSIDNSIHSNMNEQLLRNKLFLWDNLEYTYTHIKTKFDTLHSCSEIFQLLNDKWDWGSKYSLANVVFRLDGEMPLDNAIKTY